jgi:hypothetical protein
MLQTIEERGGFVIVAPAGHSYTVHEMQHFGDEAVAGGRGEMMLLNQS